ncbi:Acyl transferase domain-containing protein [Paenibacillus tianmuensis]|uniref:Acyl transferase domain-containing protein n=1 Tax=Paenibacillus tianmuensis TaxID=624147 RepID=A0A1G4QZI2_9BACL|nr:SDR family NAD(P)-dependent oxidoreductase [Paenibacillus tianmuensis]SCW49801.1 Acyl transferase domain-containing protein [Paenibacillus tianmuensis]
MTQTPKREVAIVGIAGRFPGAKNTQEFWNNLNAGLNSISVIPQDRWKWEDVYGDPQKEENKTNSKWGGFIEEVDRFDPLFFGISPKEANFIDPQHRLFLETVWQVIENAGYSPKSLSGRKIGVYAGVSKNDYAELMGENISAFVSTGTVHSILANRVSYFFNFRGPSEAVDTACSSSLVALHNAVRDIREGECEAAIVGGVNALLSPRMYISHAKSGMLSVDGQCKTFDASANGYVRGEGVAALFLKPLDKAVEDRDNILGVIKATAINHGGRSNFLTAPNVTAQSEVVYTVLQRSEADPRNISYIEAHGTGTPLGDPIEINALKKAYGQYYEERGLQPRENSCLLGSVKTNIGHLESAAGMASIIKVLLAMKHGVLPELLNFTEINPYISFEGSPFGLVTAPTAWKKRRIEGKLLPRQAGVSGFGMGGVNAHVILEEPPRSNRPRAKSASQKRLVLLSAKKGKLRASAERLLTFLQSEAGQSVHVDDLAFTLMFGREEFEERLAMVASSVEQVVEELERYVSEQASLSLFQGVAVTKPDAPVQVATSTDDLFLLAEAWVKGEGIEWEQASFHGSRIEVPGYPFERLRCWFEPKTVKADANAASGDKQILLPATERMVQDHLVQRQKVLPGVGYLDLIVGELKEEWTAGVTFQDVYWLKPLAVLDEPRTLLLNVKEEGSDRAVRIRSGVDLHCQGRLLKQVARTEERIEVEEIRKRCETKESKAELYGLFSENGLVYGPSFQVIETLHYSADEAIAEVDVRNHGRIAAGILDGALQTAVCLSVRNGTASESQYVPYYAESFTVAGSLEAVRYYYVKQRQVQQSGSIQFDLYLCDGEGRVLASVKNFTKRALVRKEEARNEETRKEAPSKQGLLYYTSKWREEACGPEAEAKGLLLLNGSESLADWMRGELGEEVPFRRLTIAEQDPDRYLEALQEVKASGFAVRQILVPAVRPGVEDLRGLLVLAGALIKSRFKEPIKILYAGESMSSEALPALYAAGGLARTLKYEYPRLHLEVAAFTDRFENCGRALLEELFASAPAPLHEVRYVGGTRQLREMVTVAGGLQKQAYALRQGGVYLIAGGTGGLGQIFSDYLAKEYQAKVVLLGRREQDERIAAQLDRLASLGGSGLYIRADLGDAGQVRAAVEQARATYGSIHGVLQGSGLIEDSFILRKTTESFEKVLQPKLAGTLHLDDATAGDELDFFVMFSSIAALMPNQGQCDYSSGNSFMDAYAAHRQQLVAEGRRSGLSLAINWPLWANGGMTVEPEEKEHLWKVFGMQPLETPQGLVLLREALHLASQEGFAHIVGIEGDQMKINQHFGIRKKAETVRELDVPTMIRRDLYSILAQALHLAPAEIGASQPLQQLGVASLSLLQIANLISQYFSVDFKPPLLFEHGTSQQILDYLLQDRQRAVIEAHYAELGALAPLYRSSGLIDLNKVDGEQGLYQRRYDNTEFYQVDHVVDNKYNVPGACYAEMARQAGALALPGQRVSKLLNCYWAKQLSSSGEPFDVFIQLLPKGERTDYEIYRMEGAERVVHATGALEYAPWQLAQSEVETLDLAAIRERCTASWTREQVYQQIHAEGLIVGESFMPMQEMVLNEQEALATLELPEMIADTYEEYLLHPTMLTGVFQTALINNRFHGDDERDFIPIAIESLEMWGIVPRRCHVYSEVSPKTKNNPDIKKFNLTVCDEEGRVVARLVNFSIKATNYEKSALVQAAAPVSTAQTQAVRDRGVAVLRSRAQEFVRGLLSEAIGLEPSMIRPEEAFEAYGINSVMILELNKLFEDAFGSGLSKTLFFEYRNLEDLTGYFLEEYEETLRSLLQLRETLEVDEVVEAAVESTVAAVASAQETARSADVVETVAMTPHAPAVQDIAIIGLAGRYPQAGSLAEFWANIQAGKDCIEEIRPDRFDYVRYYDPDKQNDKLYSKWGSFLDDVDKFDPMFFNIPPREAELMDPQERMFLEVVWHALEDAGYTRQSLRDQSVGVFVGALWQPYQELGVLAQAQGHVLSPSTLLYSIANRVSYFCNFNGPSLTVDTACSSSLTALHLACQSLLNGESSVAIAGGVNLSIGAGKYLFLSQYKFLATDGRCRSFGADGDGYVPGEGIGAVLLKPLDQAVKDGDHIYGVIKATAVNHGGKTNGYTVPNPTAQSDMILKALERAKINPRAISYIEAHGTGTALGDPIEITGLSRAFGKYTRDKQFCAIGSVKSNIGHLEASAGIAGLTKVLLQLKHRRIAPSLHSQQLNANIDFRNSPFVVPQELMEWKRPLVEIDGQTREFPRLAGLSSFGAGGANAHVIIEEYQAVEQQRDHFGTAPHVIVLSAKNADRLQEQAQRLLQAVESGAYSDADMPAIAYTLQLGRETMEERLAVLASSLKELSAKLQDFLSGKRGIDGLFHGHVKHYKDTLALFAQDEDMQAVIEAWQAKGKFGKLLDLWAKGLSIDWSRQYATGKPGRISLPGYPFAKERYWLPIDGAVQSGTGVGRAAMLHPLVHENTSDLTEVRFRSTLTGREFFLRDHVVYSNPVLPSVAELELARAAALLATGLEANDPTSMRLKDVVWPQPIVAAGESIRLHVGLHALEDGEIAYEISGDIPQGEEAPTLYSYGEVEICAFDPAPPLDLHALQVQSGLGVLTAEQCYDAFRAMGTAYGPSLQGIETLYLGESHVLAKLALPSAALATEADYVLHPTLLEAAVQAVNAFTLKQTDRKPTRPVSLQSLDILRPCPSAMWALIRSGEVGYDLDLCDETGEVCVQMRGLVLEPVEGEWQGNSTAAERKMYFLKKVWEPCSAAPSRSVNRAVAILTTPETRSLATELAKRLPQSRLFDVAQEPQELDWQAYDGLIDLVGCGQERKESAEWMSWLQLLIEHGRRDGMMLLGVTKGLEGYQNATVNLAGASRAALYRMLQSEYGHVQSRHLDLEPVSDETRLAEQIAAEFLVEDEETEACWRNGLRYRARLKEWEKGEQQARTPFPEDQVLWIAGGTRGLGYLCAQHFVKHYGVKRLVLTGRETLPPRETWAAHLREQTPVSRKIQGIQALEREGAQVMVLSVPLSDVQAVEESVQAVRRSLGPIGGVLHAAGLLDEENSAFIRKTVEGIEQVLEPKVAGLDALYRSLRAEPLQFFVAFSSVSATIPSLAAGLSDYAVANAYMDYLAEAKRPECPIVSVQWPSWKEAGMGEVKSRAYEQTGLLTMTNAEGLEFLDYVLARKIGPVAMSAVVNPSLWNPQTLMQHKKQTAALPTSPVVPAQRPAAPAQKASVVAGGQGQTAEAWVRSIFAKELKMDPAKIEVDAQIADYGVDSILQAQLLRQIAQALQVKLDPSLLLEFPTIESLAKHLEALHGPALANATGATQVQQEEPTAPSYRAPSRPAKPRVAKQGQAAVRKAAPASGAADLAVVGLSCRLPGAASLEQYWQLLSEGRSAIREVPQGRWGYSSGFYAGLLDDITQYDPSFFHLSEEDAKAMDPQALLVLEESLKLLCHAGYTQQEVKGRSVGVYLGARSKHSPSTADLGQTRNPILAVGQNYLAANISQYFDLRGPCVVVDTACSSALVGMNMAAQALQSGEIESAIVGGVSLLTTDETHRIFEQRNILNREGAFHLFDRRADGIVVGEGCGMVLLKTVEQALRDGDAIYAVIKAVAVNNNGRTAGPATPSLEAQKQVLQAALRKGGVSPEAVRYIETNGSGTQVTDLLELKTIQSVYRASSNLPLGLGSMKPNIGHPLCAEGIAGFIKVVLMLQRRQMVPFLSGEEAMTHYDLQVSPFEMACQLMPWTDTARIAAINCFADGGTNAHVILEGWEESEERSILRKPIPLPVLQRRDVSGRGQGERAESAMNIWKQIGVEV